MKPNDIKEKALEYRGEIQQIGDKIKLAKEDYQKQPAAQDHDAGEVIANLTLAYRHLEDARMRLGKAVQAYDGGTSVYEK